MRRMGAQQTMNDVAEILSRGGVTFQRSDNQQEYRLLVGSTAIMISATESGDATFVHLKCPLVLGVNLRDAKTMGNTHHIVNTLNRQNYFIKFCIHDDHVSAEMDLFGNDLENQLGNALSLLAQTADGVDDALAKELKAKTYFEWLQAK